MARGDLPTAFHEAGHAVAAWRRGLKIHSVTIVPTPEFRGHIQHANPLQGIHLDYDGSPRARLRAEAAIVVCLAGPEAQRRFSPRSWRSFHGATDHELAADLAMSLNGSDEAVNAHLKWLSIVTRDEIAVWWPLVEKVAHALVRERTLTAVEIKSLLTAPDVSASSLQLGDMK
jgi:hypothetical protein